MGILIGAVLALRTLMGAVLAVGTLMGADRTGGCWPTWRWRARASFPSSSPAVASCSSPAFSSKNEPLNSHFRHLSCLSCSCSLPDSNRTLRSSALVWVSCVRSASDSRSVRHWRGGEQGMEMAVGNSGQGAGAGATSAGGGSDSRHTSYPSIGKARPIRPPPPPPRASLVG